MFLRELTRERGLTVNLSGSATSRVSRNSLSTFTTHSPGHVTSGLLFGKSKKNALKRCRGSNKAIPTAKEQTSRSGGG